MTELNVPWAAWYGTQQLAMRFPAGWQVGVYRMRGGVSTSEKALVYDECSPGQPVLRPEVFILVLFIQKQNQT